MAKQNHYDYFTGFQKIASHASETARMLLRSFREFQQDTLPAHLDAMHQLEHEADLLGHEMMHHLARDFITPIERDDLMRLANELDEVVDSIEDVLLRYICTMCRLSCLKRWLSRKRFCNARRRWKAP